MYYNNYVTKLIIGAFAVRLHFAYLLYITHAA